MATSRNRQEFGREMRRLRLAYPMSLTQLARRVHFSKSHLSKVERALQQPSAELARLCDAQLRAEGALVRLAAEEPPAAEGGTGDEDEVWVMSLRGDGTGGFRPVRRRDVVTSGAAALLPLRPSPAGLVEGTGAGHLLDAQRAVFRQFRALGQTAGPAALLPSLVAQTYALEQQAGHASGSLRAGLLVLASRYAEYTGWMAQESGEERAALWWTDRAVRLAVEGGDNDLTAYALVRTSLVSLYAGRVQEAVELAGSALENRWAAPRTRALAAQHLAQALSVRGEHAACMRALDRSRELFGSARQDPDAPVLGSSQVPDVVSMFTGWCLHDLGRPRQAAEVLDRETAQLPEAALRTRARHGVRRALAHAVAGEIEHACRLTSDLLPRVNLVDSATILADLHRLARVLRRHARLPSVRELNPALSLALAARPSA